MDVELVAANITDRPTGVDIIRVLKRHMEEEQSEKFVDQLKV